MKIHLIRHGMTIANEKKLYCGQTDLSLTDKGIEQLINLKSEITFPTGDIFITSRLKRTYETMEVLYNKKPNIIMPELNEFNFGDFEMKNYEELKNELQYISWITGDENVKCPKGESKKIFQQRVMEAFKKIKKLNAKDIVVICHGGVIATIMSEIFKEQINFYEWQPTHGRGYTILEEETWIEQYKL